MKRLTSVSLGLVLCVAGCDASPLQALVQETFGSGQHLQTNQFIQEIAPGLPFPTPPLAVSADLSRYAYFHRSEKGRLYVGKSGHPAKPVDAHSSLNPWWSPNATHLAYVELLDGETTIFRWALKVLDLQTSKTVTVTEELHGPFPWLAWSPDGTSLLYASEGEGGAEGLYLVPLSSPIPKQVAEVPPGRLGAAAHWGPDSKQFAYLAKSHGFLNARDLTIHTFADGTNKVLRRIPGQVSPVWSTTGGAIGYLVGELGSGEFADHRVLLADGSEEVTPFSLGAPVTVESESGAARFVGFSATDLSPDLRWCIITHGDDPLYARELSTGKHVQLTDAQASVKGWSADGKAIVARTTKGDVHRYYRVQIER